MPETSKVKTVPKSLMISLGLEPIRLWSSNTACSIGCGQPDDLPYENTSMFPLGVFPMVRLYSWRYMAPWKKSSSGREGGRDGIFLSSSHFCFSSQQHGPMAGFVDQKKSGGNNWIRSNSSMKKEMQFMQTNFAHLEHRLPLKHSSVSRTYALRGELPASISRKASSSLSSSQVPSEHSRQFLLLPRCLLRRTRFGFGVITLFNLLCTTMGYRCDDAGPT